MRTIRKIPIIFSGPMVRAFLDKRKRMTRRLAWRPPTRPAGVLTDPKDRESKPTHWHGVKPGDILWVKETHWRFGRWLRSHDSIRTPPKWRFVPHSELPETISFKEVPPSYAPPHRAHDVLGWWRRPNIFHPRKFSRITLVVTATKIERLQKISPDDAWNEGVERLSRSVRQMWLFGADAAEREAIYKRACVWEFEQLWKSLHGPGSWDANPEVVALTVDVHITNIDAMPELAAA